MPTPPVACSLTREELDAGRDALLPGLVRRARVRDVLPDGYAYEFDGTDELFRLVTDTIARERRCCRFLEFRVTIASESGPLRLEIVGPEGTKAFLEQLTGADPESLPRVSRVP